MDLMENLIDLIIIAIEEKFVIPFLVDYHLNSDQKITLYFIHFNFQLFQIIIDYQNLNLTLKYFQQIIYFKVIT